MTRFQTSPEDAKAKLILVGKIVGAHGIQGDVLVHTYTAEPRSIASYGPLESADRRLPIELRVVRVTPKGVVAKIKGVADRTAAEAMKGTELFVPRDRLPQTAEREYYHADLIGLAAVAPDNSPVGTVVAVANFGAGDLLEVALAGSRRTEFVAFSDAFVPVVDVAGGQVIVIMPADDPDDDDDVSAPEAL